MKNIKLTAEEMVIVDRLKQMKMSGMAEAYEEQIQNPNSDLSGFYERFSNHFSDRLCFITIACKGGLLPCHIVFMPWNCLCNP